MGDTLTLQELWISPSGRIPEQVPGEDIETKAAKIVLNEYIDNLFCGLSEVQLLLAIGWCAVTRGGILIRKPTGAQIEQLLNFRNLVASIHSEEWNWFLDDFSSLASRSLP